MRFDCDLQNPHTGEKRQITVSLDADEVRAIRQLEIYVGARAAHGGDSEVMAQQYAERHVRDQAAPGFQLIEGGLAGTRKGGSMTSTSFECDFGHPETGERKTMIVEIDEGALQSAIGTRIGADATVVAHAMALRAAYQQVPRGWQHFRRGVRQLSGARVLSFLSKAK